MRWFFSLFRRAEVQIEIILDQCLNCPHYSDDHYIVSRICAVHNCHCQQYK